MSKVGVNEDLAVADSGVRAWLGFRMRSRAMGTGFTTRWTTWQWRRVTWSRCIPVAKGDCADEEDVNATLESQERLPYRGGLLCILYHIACFKTSFRHLLSL